MCGKARKIKLKGEYGQPGYQAWGLADPKAKHRKTNPFAGTTGMQHPKTVGTAFDAVQAPGSVASISGREIHSTIRPFDLQAAGSPIFGKNFLSEEGLHREAQRYGERFKSDWYNPYIKAAVDRPVAESMRQGLVAADEKLRGFTPQGVLSDYTGPRAVGQYNTGTAGPFSQGTILMGGEVDEGGAKDERQKLNMALESKQSALDVYTEDKADLAISRQELEDEKIRTADLKEEDLVTAMQDRGRAQQELAVARAGDLSGQIAEHQEALAPMAKSGFAYSGAAQAQLEQASQDFMNKMKGTTVEKRLAEEDYQSTIKNIEQDYDAAVRGFATTSRGYDRDERGIQRTYDDSLDQFKQAKLGYGAGLKELMSDSASGVPDIRSWLGSIGGAHHQFGKDIAEHTEWGSGKSQAGYRLRGTGKADIVGAQTYNAPGGGWFKEGSQGLASVQGAEQDALAAIEFAKHLDQMGAEDYTKAAFGTKWEDDDVETPVGGSVTSGDF
tara:strand:- start:3022 stop:4518 length:1497 start_codon:yes stop_codon:yes gene_type:complete